MRSASNTEMSLRCRMRKLPRVSMRSRTTTLAVGNVEVNRSPFRLESR